MALREQAQEDPEIVRTVEVLGGRRILHRHIRNRLEAHDVIKEGLPGQVLNHLVIHVAIFSTPKHRSMEKAIGISFRTFQRKKVAATKLLSAEQSARTWKFAEILGRATEVLGSKAEAERWLEEPAMALEERKPIDLLSTPAGVELVEDHLTRLEYGVYT